MRAPLFNLSTVARAAGFALVAVAMVATTIDLGGDQTMPRPARTVVAPQTDPLMQEVTRCEALGTAAEQDASCEAAWTENRRRFFIYAPADSGSPATQTRNQPASNREDR